MSLTDWIVLYAFAIPAWFITGTVVMIVSMAIDPPPGPKKGCSEIVGVVLWPFILVITLFQVLRIPDIWKIIHRYNTWMVVTGSKLRDLFTDR